MSASLARMFNRAFIDSYKQRLKCKTYYRVARFGYLAIMSTEFNAKNHSQQYRVYFKNLVMTTEL